MAKNVDRSKQLGEEKVGILLFKFSLPAIVGMLVNALYNMVDRIFIGRGVGALAISGLAVGFPLSIINMAFGMLIGIGSSTMISIKLGEKKKEEAERILGNALVLIIIISIFISIVGIVFLDDILKIFGASAETLPYARDYMKYIMAGALLQNVGFSINNIIRAEGNPKIAMSTMLIGAVINTVLDPIFIFVFKMGIKGAAIATIFAQAVSSIWVLYYFFSGKSTLKIKRENLSLDKGTIKTIMSIGISPFSMQIASSLVTTIFNKKLLIYGGDLAVGAMGIVNSISMLFLMPMFGINQGMQPIIGYNFGAKQYKRVRETLKLAIKSAVIIATIGFLVIEVFPTALIKIFNKDEQLVSIGVHGMKIFLSMLPVVGFQVVSSNYFQAVGKAKIAIFLSLSRQVILLIPMLLILPSIFGLNGVWIVSPVSDVLAGVITMFFLSKDMKQLKRLERVTEIK